MMERNPEEELFQRLAEAIGESLEQVCNMADAERRQLLEVIFGNPLVEQKEGSGAIVIRNFEEDRNVQGSAIVEEGLEGYPKEHVEDPNKEQVVLEELTRVGIQADAIGEVAETIKPIVEDELEGYLEEHMEDPNRVQVVLEELTGMGTQADR